MAGELRIDVIRESSADPAAVWKLLSDIDTWKVWGQWSDAGLEQPGTAEAPGVGAIRRFKLYGRVTRETVVAYEPPTRFAYELISGLPLRNYHAEVTVVPAGGGSRLEWHSRFDATFAARLWRPGLAWFIGNTATRLVRAAEAG